MIFNLQKKMELVTKEDLIKLFELKESLTLKIKDLSLKVEEARQYGDLRENADYNSFNMKRNMYLEKRGEIISFLEKVKIFLPDPKQNSIQKVQFGSEVTLKKNNKDYY